jgi:hypothetical protein
MVSTVSTPLSWSVHRWFGFHQFGCFSLPARAQRPAGSGVFLAVISSHREWFQRMEKMNFSMVQRLGKTWWNVVETSWTETWWECGEYKQKSTGKTETRLNCMERRACIKLIRQRPAGAMHYDFKAPPGETSKRIATLKWQRCRNPADA